ncbi:type ISP restriction/modification enzyme [Paraburkholderia sediminicola]|uniref:type ISP restriction/modification enzyme n=1 Tax=Paraburkholderia sediminicola TaxID=458836 RepID=UPI0038B9CCB4
MTKKTSVTLDSAVSKFGEHAKKKLSNTAAVGAPEDQLRAPFEHLLEDLSEICSFAPGSVVPVGEQSLSDLKTRPDYTVTTIHGALIGFVEIKAPGKGADPRRFRDKHDKEQWLRLKQLPNLMYTDGNEFSLWQHGELVDAVVRLNGDIETSGNALSANIDLVTLFSSFLQWKPQSPHSVKELAVVAARMCRLLRDEVTEQLALDSPVFKGFASDWRTMLFPEASDDRFADGYAQAVTFGLLMARAQGVSLANGFAPVIKALKGAGSLIGSAIQLLVDDSAQESIKTSTVTLSRVLDVVNWPKLSKGKSDAWLYFYEDFLEVYDNELRKQTGSYYTPPEVVSAMVRWTSEVLRGPAFNLPLGLASQSVRLIDPATGTGTYLLGVLREIADQVRKDQGDGAVAAAVHSALANMAGFEIQLGPYAVAQLRVLAEVVALTGAKLAKAPQLFVTDTLGNPYDDGGKLAQIFAPLAESRKAANKIKREAQVTVIIGNPPYKEKSKGKGGWVETGDPSREIAPLLDVWQLPTEWRASAHSKHLRNLYVYFWRWATWKVWEHGPGDKNGIVCFITVSGFLNGPGFQQMRTWLRETCDDIWVVDCSPEGHQPEASTRIFQGVQQAVCIVMASRSLKADKKEPAPVRFRALPKGHRNGKFEALTKIDLYGGGWTYCPTHWRAPFLPESAGAWSTFPRLEDLFTYDGSGVMAGRTWVIAPDADSLLKRWDKLTATPPGDVQERLFHPHLRKGKPGDKHSNKKASKGLAEQQLRLMPVSADKGACIPPLRYAFRSFDRQWIIPDVRLINQPNPTLWQMHSPCQIYLTAFTEESPANGPALTASGLIPDLHHYKGSFGGRVFPLWSNADAQSPNMPDRLIELLSEQYESPVSAEDLFAYIVGVVAHPEYTARFQEDLSTPGLRVPITASADLFLRMSALGRRALWLHTYGERMVDPVLGRPAGAPRVAQGESRPTVPKEGAFAPDSPLPDQLTYDEAKQRLHLGIGFIDHVTPAVWNYTVDGKQIIPQWFSYRKLDRSKPPMGDKRPPSPLQDIQPEHWLAQYTADLLDLLNVLTLLVDLEPKQAELLEQVCIGAMISESDLLAAGAIAQNTAAPKAIKDTDEKQFVLL